MVPAAPVEGFRNGLVRLFFFPQRLGRKILFSSVEINVCLADKFCLNKIMEKEGLKDGGWKKILLKAKSLYDMKQAGRAESVFINEFELLS